MWPFRSRTRQRQITALRPAASSPSLPIAMPLLRGEPPQRNVEALLVAYSTSPWLRAVVGRIAMSAATIPWQLYAPQATSGGPFTMNARLAHAPYPRRVRALSSAIDEGRATEIDEHPLLTLLNGTAGALLGMSLRQLTHIYLELVGEAYWQVGRNGFGMPTSLTPIPPHWIAETPSRTSPSYKVRWGTLDEDVPSKDMIAFVQPNPHSPFGRGSGIAQALADEIDIDEYAAKTARSQFYNSAVPPLLIFGADLTPDDVRQIRESWFERLQGFWRRGIPHFLNRKVEVKELSQNFESMEFSKLREHERDVMIQAFGIPPEIIGILENSNRATIGASEYLYNKQVIVPRMEFMRAVLQERLVPQYDPRLILSYEDPVEEDNEFYLRGASAMPSSLRVDEWRRMQGLPPLGPPQGDRFIVTNRVAVYDELGGDMSPGYEEKEKRDAAVRAGVIPADVAEEGIVDDREGPSADDEPPLQ